MLNKFLVTVTATKEYPPSKEFPKGTRSIQKARVPLFAASEAEAIEQVKQADHNPENLPTTYEATKLSFWFECETREVKNLRWWEKAAIDNANWLCEDHHDDKSLEDLAQSIEDGWSEHIQRDGEPGPKPGHVEFDLNKAGTKLTIRSTRILAVITLKKEVKNG